MKNLYEINFDAFPYLLAFLQATNQIQMRQVLSANPLQASYILNPDEQPENILSICVALNKTEHVDFLLKRTEFQEGRIVLQSLFTRWSNLISNKTNLPGVEEAIEQAASCGQVQALALLFETEQGKQLVQTDYKVRNLMHLAITNGQQSVVEYFIEQQEIINTLYQDNRYWPNTCLYEALESRQTELFKQLLQMVLFRRFATHFNNGLLNVALVTRQYDAIAYLLEIPAVIDMCGLHDGFIWFLLLQNDPKLVDIFLPIYENQSINIDYQALNKASKEALFYLTNTDWANNEQRGYWANTYVIALKLLTLSLRQGHLIRLDMEEIKETLLPLVGLLASSYLMQKMDIGGTEEVAELKPQYDLLNTWLENPAIFKHLVMLAAQEDSRYAICRENFIHNKLTDLRQRYDAHRVQHPEIEFDISAAEVPLFLELVSYLLRNGESLEEPDMKRLFTLPSIQSNLPQWVSKVDGLNLGVNSQDCFNLIALPDVQHLARHNMVSAIPYMVSGIHGFFTNGAQLEKENLGRPSVLRPQLMTTHQEPLAVFEIHK